MRFERLAAFLFRRLWRVSIARKPDFVIGDDYMRRWHLVRRNPVCNIYLHQFMHSDDDRALHCHPWPNASFLLEGTYVEHTIAAGGIHRRKAYRHGDLKFRRAKSAHRIELTSGPCWSLFITGPRVRDWGFHCPEQGFIPWQRFTAPGDKGKIGKGCEG